MLRPGLESIGTELLSPRTGQRIVVLVDELPGRADRVPARAYRDELDGFGDFDLALIDEAKALAKSLRERSASAINSEAKANARTALEWRNRLATLLAQDVALVRRTARFVFRHHPQIRREVTSAYERRTRAARRRSAPVSIANSDTASE